MLNRPSHVPVGAVLPPWDGRTTGTDVLFTGGPVAEDSALALGLHTGPRTVPSPTASGAWPGRLASSTLDVDPDTSLAEIDAIRIYAGYSGWSAGQLGDEIAEGAWYVVDGGPADVRRRPRGPLDARAAPPGRRPRVRRDAVDRPEAQLTGSARPCGAARSYDGAHVDTHRAAGRTRDRHDGRHPVEERTEFSGRRGRPRSGSRTT